MHYAHTAFFWILFFLCSMTRFSMCDDWPFMVCICTIWVNIFLFLHSFIFLFMSPAFRVYMLRRHYPLDVHSYTRKQNLKSSIVKNNKIIWNRKTKRNKKMLRRKPIFVVSVSPIGYTLNMYNLCEMRNCLNDMCVLCLCKPNEHLDALFLLFHCLF